MHKRFTAALLILLLLCSQAALADANITDQCKFQVNSNHNWLSSAFDGKDRTHWASDSGGERYIQLAKPRGEYVLWRIWFEEVPQTLDLCFDVDGQWANQYTYENPESPLDVAVPADIRYARLYVNGERLMIQEMAVLAAEPPAMPTPAITLAPPATPVPTLAATPTPAPTATPTAQATATPAATPVATAAPTPHPTPAATPTATAKPTPAPTAASTPEPTAEPTPKATPRSTPSPSPLPTTVPTPTPMPTPVATVPPATPRPPMHTATPAPLTHPMTASGLVDFVQGQLGAGYIMGTYGHLITKDFRYGRADLYPDAAPLILTFGAQWDGGIAYDCMGLIKAFAIQGGIPVADVRDVNVAKAFGLWITEYGPLEGAVLQPGMALIRMEGNHNATPHIGVYVGNGDLIHARGTRWGVVQGQIPGVFTHWAKLTFVEYDLPMETEIFTNKPWLDVGQLAVIDTDDARSAPVFATPVEAGKRRPSIGAFPFGTVVTIEEAPDEMSRKVTGIDVRGRLLTGYVRLTSLSAID